MKDVIETLPKLMTEKGVPERIPSDNGSEGWGPPWENGYVESFNGEPRDELLNREVLCTPLEVLPGQYRQTYNRIGARNSLGYRPPA